MRSTLRRVVLVSVATVAVFAAGASPADAGPPRIPIPWFGGSSTNPFPWIPTDHGAD